MNPLAQFKQIFTPVFNSRNIRYANAFWLIGLLFLAAACQSPSVPPADIAVEAVTETTPNPTSTSVPDTPTAPPETPAPPSPTATSTATAPPPPTPTHTPQPGNSFYVSKLGSNEDGRSWDTAWNELDQIDWSAIQPGDTIWLDGGVEEMVYRTSLTPQQSGTAEKPIHIMRSAENGRSGNVVLFGGRETLLPYCGQEDYLYQEEGVLSDGIYLQAVAHLVIDGRSWRGITIYGFNGHGVALKGDTDHITLRNMELTDNGTAIPREDGLFLGGKGIDLRGSRHLFERLIIHDNGQDSIQSNGENLSDFVLRESWLYNGRSHPIVTEQSSNYCTHSDALQIFDGVQVEQITIEDSILGPGFTNTLILGDKTVNVNHVTLRNTLILKAAENNISAHSSATTDVKHWTLENVTVYAPTTAYNTITFKGEEITITDSVFVGGHINIPNAEPTISGNCQWQTNGISIGQEIDPKFDDALSDPFIPGSYVISAAECANKGAGITSVNQLLSLQD